MGRSCKAVDSSNGVWSCYCPGLWEEECKWGGKQGLDGEIYRGYVSGTVASCKSSVKTSLFLIC